MFSGVFFTTEKKPFSIQKHIRAARLLQKVQGFDNTTSQMFMLFAKPAFKWLASYFAH